MASGGYAVSLSKGSRMAAGAGLNVTAANHVFHFTRAWNPSKEAQATDRAYRIGQERDVFVYCPTVVADDFHTFEVRLDQLLKRKAGLAGATLDDGGLTAMLNGSGKDASFSELVGDGGGGEVEGLGGGGARGGGVACRRARRRRARDPHGARLPRLVASRSRHVSLRQRAR